jgi:hypothetical protein
VDNGDEEMSNDEAKDEDGGRTMFDARYRAGQRFLGEGGKQRQTFRLVIVEAMAYLQKHVILADIFLGRSDCLSWLWR